MMISNLLGVLTAQAWSPRRPGGRSVQVRIAFHRSCRSVSQGKYLPVGWERRWRKAHLPRGTTGHAEPDAEAGVGRIYWCVGDEQVRPSRHKSRERQGIGSSGRVGVTPVCLVVSEARAARTVFA